ncbi:MAG: pitrilysin family protein [Phycisphaerales bacterium]
MPRRAAMLAAVAALGAIAAPGIAQHIDCEEFTLDNGMTFLLLPRDEQPLNVAAGWVARVGSVNEPAGMSGVTHFLEHMMFKGTDVVGTTDAGADRDFRAKLEDLREQLFAKIYEVQYDRFRLGEIDDPWDAKNDTPEIRAIRSQITALQDEQKSVTVNNEFDRLYTAEGASGMNAQTFYDWTRYFITVPSNKLELWCWLESDRLGEPSLREFDSEKDVVVEERRQRFDGSPTGELDEQFYSMLWMASPYNWPVIGWPSDLQAYTEQATRAYFKLHYQPRNLVGVIVGDFDPAVAKQLVTSYFGRLQDPGEPIPPVTTIEMKRKGDLVFTGECDCQPQTSVAYQGVPYGHKDEAVLDVIADLLNGQTGRLYKSLIEDKGIASSAEAANHSFKYAGGFLIEAQVKGDATPQQLEDALLDQVEILINEPVPERELQKVKNRTRADAVRAMRSNMGLLQQILMTEAYGSWEDINAYPEKIDAVTPDDIMRVAGEYLGGSRGVSLYTRKPPEDGEAPKLTLDGALAAVPEAMREQVRGGAEQQLDELAQATVENIPDLEQALEDLNAQRDKVPESLKPLVNFVEQEINAKLADLRAQQNGGEG